MVFGVQSPRRFLFQDSSQNRPASASSSEGEPNMAALSITLYSRDPSALYPTADPLLSPAALQIEGIQMTTLS